MLYRLTLSALLLLVSLFIFRWIYKYGFEKHNINYILLSKFQTNYLELRWGEYRKLSGSNYHVTFQQIIESEKKTRIRRIIRHFSESLKRGDGYLTLLNLIECEIDEYNDIFGSNYLQNQNSSNDQVLNLYVSGYVSYSIVKELSCKNCIDLILLSKGT